VLHRDNRSAPYTELNKTPSGILATEKVKFLVPSRHCATTDKNTSKYCEYHRERGHETDDCWNLRQAIEKAVKTGKLAHLVKKNIKEGRQPNGRGKFIPVVRRREDPWWQSMRQKASFDKECMRHDIVFSSLFGLDPNEDPIVITIDIARYTVRGFMLITEVLKRSCMNVVFNI
jgi:hypothetical protein